MAHCNNSLARRRGNHQKTKTPKKKR
jgi:hypothetical protein